MFFKKAVKIFLQGQQRNDFPSVHTLRQPLIIRWAVGIHVFQLSNIKKTLSLFPVFIHNSK